MPARKEFIGESVEELAALVAFVASPEEAYDTGADLTSAGHECVSNLVCCQWRAKTVRVC